MNDQSTADFSAAPLLSLLPSGRFPRWILKPLDRLLGLRALSRIYAGLERTEGGDEFLAQLLKALRVEIDSGGSDLESVPRSGAAVVVANHPFGGIEGIVLAFLLRSIRPDVKVMANYMLGRIPELRELFLLVDPFGSGDAGRRNRAPLREALRWLKGGGMLVAFPAGEVAHLDLRRLIVRDSEWSPTIAGLVRRSSCPVIPVHFEGRNRMLFHLLGLLHPALRTAMLPRELLARRGRTIRVRVGGPIPFRHFAGCSDEGIIAHLRSRTEVLGLGGRQALQPRRTPIMSRPVIPPVDSEALEREVLRLPSTHILHESGGRRVCFAEAWRIPHLLREIGRLREVSFRAVGEGTGREIDLDAFDEYYLHLFVWHEERRELIGAYRLGMIDRILKARGLAGLYISTLFRFELELFESLGPALELGRSFIRPEYQKSFAGLLLLWKGIARFVVEHPEYAVLLGPVSVSADYHSASRQLITTFLKENNLVHPFSRRVRPRSPFRPRRKYFRGGSLAHLQNLDQVSAHISEIESDRKGVPILLRQYLKLGGRILGFNVDPDFSDVLDLLIMVDLRNTEVRNLSQYMGSEDADHFLKHRIRELS